MSTSQRWLLFILLVLAGQARAQDAPSIVYSGTGGVVTGGTITKVAPTDFQRLITRVPGAGVAVRDGILGKVNGQTDFELLLNRTITKKGVGLAGAAALRTLPFVGTGFALWDIYDALRIRPDDASDGLVWDPGVPPTLKRPWCNSHIVSPSACVFGSADAALNSRFAAEFPNPSIPACNNNWLSNRLWTQGPTQIQGSTANAQSASRTVTYTATSWSIFNCTGSSSPRIPEVGNIVVTQGAETLSCLDGSAPQADGKCKTNNYTTPIAIIAAGQRWEDFSPDAQVEPTARDTLNRGGSLVPDVAPLNGTLSGPSTVALPGSTTTTTGPNGTTTTTTGPQATITYGPSNVSNSWSTTIVTTTTTVNNGGSPTTTTTSTAPEVKMCGLPGQPPCKIDETGTPTVIPPFSTTPIDATKTTDASKQDTEINRVVNPGFGWFSVPPMATCAPIAWPGGVQINPCNGIEVVRSIMAYLWALYGAVWSFGVFRRSLPGAA